MSSFVRRQPKPRTAGHVDSSGDGQGNQRGSPLPPQGPDATQDSGSACLAASGGDNCSGRGGNPSDGGRTPTWQGLPLGCAAAPGGRVVTSTGLRDLDKALGPGLTLGSLVLVEEDPFSPIHLILLRYFLAQGMPHEHRALLAAPLPDPRAFLGTLPRVSQSMHPQQQMQKQQRENLRIAWQYGMEDRAGKQAAKGSDICSQFDLRSALSPADISNAKRLCSCCSTLTAATTASDGVSEASLPDLERDKGTAAPETRTLEQLDGRFSSFFSGSSAGVHRVAVQGLGTPPLLLPQAEQQMAALRLVQRLKARLRHNGRAVALVTVPRMKDQGPGSGGLRHMITCLRHIADVVLETIALEEPRGVGRSATKTTSDAETTNALGFLRIVKCRFPNSEVPHHLETSLLCVRTSSDKKSVLLEGLMLPPVNPASGDAEVRNDFLGCAEVGPALPLIR